MTSTFTPGLVAVLAALTIFLTLYAIYAPVQKSRKNIEDEVLGEQEVAAPTDSLGKYAKPLINNFLPQLPVKNLSPQNKTKIQDFLIKAGNPWRLNPEEFIGIEIVFSAIGFFIGLIVAVFNGMPMIPPLLLVVITTLMGTAIPYSTYNTKRIARTNEIQKQLPEALDLLVVTLTAGQPFESALNQVVPQLPEGLLKEELTRVNMQMRAGTSLEKALKNFTKEIDSEEVDSFVKAIIQAQRLGSDITETLQHQATFVRNNHEARVQKMIAKLSTTMFIPLAGTMLPAFLIIFLAPSLTSLGSML